MALLYLYLLTSDFSSSSTAITRTKIYIPLPAFVVRELEATPRASMDYYFWSGQGKLHTAVKVWETRLKRLFTLAGIPDGHFPSISPYICDESLAGWCSDRACVGASRAEDRTSHRAPLSALGIGAPAAGGGRRCPGLAARSARAFRIQSAESWYTRRTWKKERR
jgi:hypothetical protein